MRKLRQAVVVGAMLGSISMLGAGVAAADDTTEAAAPQGATSTEGTTAAPKSAPKGKHDKGDDYKITTVIECDQKIDNSEKTYQNGLVNLGDVTVPILGSGNADSTSNQNICGIDNDKNYSGSEAETENEGDLLDLL
ncbi:hypothetical protein [Streptomyces sp. B8F3]|uniref:hypothetical protein n=1 Tax=unclassified Streptomyces TaxID=2593676 RepID=UPI00325EEC01